MFSAGHCTKPHLLKWNTMKKKFGYTITHSSSVYTHRQDYILLTQISKQTHIGKHTELCSKLTVSRVSAHGHENVTRNFCLHGRLAVIQAAYIWTDKLSPWNVVHEWLSGALWYIGTGLAEVTKCQWTKADSRVKGSLENRHLKLSNAHTVEVLVATPLR